MITAKLKAVTTVRSLRYLLLTEGLRTKGKRTERWAGGCLEPCPHTAEAPTRCLELQDRLGAAANSILKTEHMGASVDGERLLHLAQSHRTGFSLCTDPHSHL